MSNIVSPLFLAGLAALVLGILMLYRTAFREGWLWGIGCLVLPPLLLLFIPMRWRRTQFGFYALLTGMLVGAAAMYAGADRVVEAWLTQPAVSSLLAPIGWNGRIRLPFKSYHPEQLPNAAEAAAIRAQEKAAASATATKKSGTSAALGRQAPPAAPVQAYQPARLDALKHYVGRQVRVTTLSGGQVVGTLKRVDSLGVTVATGHETGSVSFHVVWARLQGVEVYAPKGTVPAPAALGAPAATTAGSAPAVTVAPSVSVAPAPAATASAASQMPISPPASAAHAPAGPVNVPNSGSP